MFCNKDIELPWRVNNIPDLNMIFRDAHKADPLHSGHSGIYEVVIHYRRYIKELHGIGTIDYNQDLERCIDNSNGLL